MSVKIFSVLMLFLLGAVLAATAELPYGGWIQIPLLSILWWRLDPSIANTFKKTIRTRLLFRHWLFCYRSLVDLHKPS